MLEVCAQDIVCAMIHTGLPVTGKLDPFVVLGVLLLECCQSWLATAISRHGIPNPLIPLALTANVLLVGALMRSA